MMAAQRRWLWASVATAVTGAIASILAPGKAYPACDDRAARAELTKLYDNQRLMHVVEVEEMDLVNDGWNGRHCSATVKWADGSESEIKYEFDHTGRHNTGLSMWIDYNGGMWGPTF